MGADLADMQLISKFNKHIQFLLCVTDIYGKYAWVVPLKDKKRLTTTKAFQEILGESGCKPNKIWVDKDREIYDRSIKSWLQDNYIEMHSTQDEGKSVVSERFITTLKNKYMTSIPKRVYIDKLDVIMNKYNAYHNTIKIKLAGVNQAHILTLSKKIIRKILNLKLVIM